MPSGSGGQLPEVFRRLTVYGTWRVTELSA